MNLRVASIESDGVVHLASEGDITLHHVQLGNDNLLRGLLGDNWAQNRVMLDFSQTAYIDSAAVGWLIASHKQFSECGGRLTLHSVRPAVLKILQMLRVDRLIPIAADAEEGRSLLRGDQK